MITRSIKEILMDRDGMSAEDAEDLIEDAKEQLLEYIDAGDFEGAENICEEYFGLEPDYISEIMPF